MFRLVDFSPKGVLWRGALAGKFYSNDGFKLEKGFFQLVILRPPSGSRPQTSGKVMDLNKNDKYNLFQNQYSSSLLVWEHVFIVHWIKIKSLGLPLETPCRALLRLANLIKPNISLLSAVHTYMIWFQGQIHRYSPSWREEAEKARASALADQIATQFRKIVDQVTPDYQADNSYWQSLLSRLTALNRGSKQKRQTSGCRSRRIHL